MVDPESYNGIPNYHPDTFRRIVASAEAGFGPAIKMFEKLEALAESYALTVEEFIELQDEFYQILDEEPEQ